MLNNKRRKWSRAEVNLLYESYRDKLSLNELIDFIEIETGRKRTKRSISSKLLKLAKLDSYFKWHPVYSFYGKEFYKQNKALFAKWRKRHSFTHRKEIKKYYIENRKKIRESQKEYYEAKKKPYKEIGDMIRYYIGLRYGNEEGCIARFVDNVVKLDISKDKNLAYHWVEGYRRPDINSLNRINILLSISEEDFKTLENLVNYHRKNSYHRKVYKPQELTILN